MTGTKKKFGKNGIVPSTEDALPIRSVPYAISPKKLEDVRKEISSLLENGIIVPSTSQWSSPIVPLIKPD